MSVLSIARDGSKGFSIAASPIYELPDLSPPNAIVFEVFVSDSGALKRLIGEDHAYVIDDNGPFRGRLEALEDADPVHPTTAFLVRPVMRGFIRRLSALSGENDLH